MVAKRTSAALKDVIDKIEEEDAICKTTPVCNRQLRRDALRSTPKAIRGKSRRKATSPSGVEGITNEIAQLDLSVEDEATKLLQICQQEAVEPFSKFIKRYCKGLEKIGEGFFGEVYTVDSDDFGKVVLKVVPVGGDEEINGEAPTSFQDICQEALISLELSKQSTPVNQGQAGCQNFIRFHAVHLCKGAYPPCLVKAWHDYATTHQSENECPDVLPGKQHYAVFVMELGGLDLEHYVFANANQIRNVFLQVCLSLAWGESVSKFEHRDLHWGNLLIQPSRRGTDDILHYEIGDYKYRMKTDVVAKIVDFTLSYLESRESDSGSADPLSPWKGDDSGDEDGSSCGDEGKDSDEDRRRSTRHKNAGGVKQKQKPAGRGSKRKRAQSEDGGSCGCAGADSERLVRRRVVRHCRDLDESFFAGQGDYQFDIYRMMQQQCGGRWHRSCPKTNIFWLHYLINKLSTAKELLQLLYTHPDSQQIRRELTALKRRVPLYESATDLVTKDELFAPLRCSS
eukprot:Rmarinus@m.765